MSHSVMPPVAAFAPLAAPVGSTPQGEDGGPGAGFAPDEETAATEAPAADGPPARDRAPDPLQRLIEALSGISGALAERPGPGDGSDGAPLPDVPAGPDRATPMPEDLPDPAVPPVAIESAAVPQAAAEASPGPAQPDGAQSRPDASGLAASHARPDAAAARHAGPAPAITENDLRHHPKASQPNSHAGRAAPEAAARPERPDALPQDAPAPVAARASEAQVPDMTPRDGGPVPADPLASSPARQASDAPETAGPRPGPNVPVARQIAEALVTARGEVIEIALAPEELGRLRMVVSGPDQAPHVTVWVERPEVLDQLRRNGAFLQECLGDAGMEGASFEFRGDTRPDSQDGRAEPAPDRHDGTAPAFAPQAVSVSWTTLAGPARLDIRI